MRRDIKVLYPGQQLTSRLKGGPRNPEKRKKWLETQQAYVQIPKMAPLIYPVKEVKDKISRIMTKRHVCSVRLGECDSRCERIEINFTKHERLHMSFNSIQELLWDSDFYIAQIMDFYYPGTITVLLIREPSRSEKAT